MTTDTTDDRREPDYPNVSRRAFLRRSALVGVAGAALPALAACGGSRSTPSVTNTPPTTAAARASDPSTATTVDGSSPTTGVPSDSVFAGDTQLQVNFTFEAAGGGSVDNPYIAVWIEDAAGELVQTVSLWYDTDESKYLRDLKRWDAMNNRAAMTTGATRIPGAFSVAWDGTDLDGATVADGDYVVCIEAAREDGPYQIICETVPISASLAPTVLTPSGELTAASVELTAP